MKSDLAGEPTAGRGAGRDLLLFLRSWVTSPLRTGAQAPSSAALGRAMAAEVDPARPGMVLELGPGTGVFTRALVARGVTPERLILLEANPDFAALMRQRYPAARVVQGDAYAAGALLDGLKIGPLAAVVSGLPLLVKPPEERVRLVRDCLRHLQPGAPFVQFTYMYRSPVPPAEGIAAKPASMVWFNLWPARVWTYRAP